MTEKSGFQNQFDRAYLAYSVLKRLRSGSVSTFNERLKSQKVQYLAQFFGVSPSYPYGLYIRGPYSTELAHDLYRFQELSITPKTDRYIPNELESRFQELKKFLEGKSNRDLELISTYHLLKKCMKMSDGAAISKLRELKEVTPSELRSTLTAVKRIPN